jgi:hypothetical protein
MAQLVELDTLLEAFERGVAGELLEAGDVHALRDAARNRSAPEAMAGKPAPSSRARPVHCLTISAIESVSIGSLPIR